MKKIQTLEEIKLISIRNLIYSIALSYLISEVAINISWKALRIINIGRSSEEGVLQKENKQITLLSLTYFHVFGSSKSRLWEKEMSLSLIPKFSSA